MKVYQLILALLCVPPVVEGAALSDHYGVWERADIPSHAGSSGMSISEWSIEWPDCKLSYELQQDEPGVSFTDTRGRTFVTGQVESYLLMTTSRACRNAPSEARLVLTDSSGSRQLAVILYDERRQPAESRRYFKSDAKELLAQASAERVAFLKGLHYGHGCSSQQFEGCDRIWRAALFDRDAQVRKQAVTTPPSHQSIPAVLEVIARDPSSEVRVAAAISLTNWITDNSAKTCSLKDEIAANLDDVLIALKRADTGPFILDVLGGRYAGEQPLPCCMSSEARRRVRTAIAEMAQDQGAQTDRPPSEVLEELASCPTP